MVCEKTFCPRDKVSGQKFCSYACRGIYQTRQATKTCPICATQFVPTRPGYQTCSRGCGAALREQTKIPDPMVKVRNKMALFCCSAIARSLRNKTDRTAALLGYSSEELRDHLERNFQQGMSWENYGKGRNDWSIDHTRPISTFPPTATIAEINSLDNLRPMWHSQNCAKKNKWEGQ